MCGPQCSMLFNAAMTMANGGTIGQMLTGVAIALIPIPDFGGAIASVLPLGELTGQAIGSALQGGILSVAQGGKFADGAKGGLIGFGLAKGISWANNKMASWAKGKQGGADVKTKDKVEYYEKNGDLLDPETNSALKSEAVKQAKEFKGLVNRAKAGDESALTRLEGVDLDKASIDADNALTAAESLKSDSFRTMGVQNSRADGAVAGVARPFQKQIFVSKTLVSQALNSGAQRHMLLHEVLHLSHPKFFYNNSNHDTVYKYQRALE